MLLPTTGCRVEVCTGAHWVGHTVFCGKRLFHSDLVYPVIANVIDIAELAS